MKIRHGIVDFSGLTIQVKTRQQLPQQVRIVPRATHYMVEVIYEREVAPADVDPAWVAGVDLGINNLAAIASNRPGFAPLLVNGRPLKSLNQWYHKRRAYLQAKLPDGQFTSRQLDLLTDKRKRQIDHYLHVASRRIVDLLVQQRIGTLVIGKNDGWKQQVRLGQADEPIVRLLARMPSSSTMVTYKAQLVGISVLLTEESHTSKCSFLDGEAVGHHDSYAGQAGQAGPICDRDRAADQRRRERRVQHDRQSGPECL